MPENKPVTLTHLTVENIKRLRIVEVTPEGNLIIVGGDNEQGKSSLLDSIEMLLNGGRSIPDRPVRQGREKGYIVGTLSNGLNIKRTIMANGNTSLVVTDAAGQFVSSPQTLFDRMKSLLTFDPLAFANAKGSEQRSILMELVGLDFSEQSAKRAELFAERAAVKKTIQLLTSQVRDEHKDTPADEVDVVAAVGELKAIAFVAAVRKDAEAVMATAIKEGYDACMAADGKIARIECDVIALKEAVKNAAHMLDGAKIALAIAREEAKKRSDEFDALPAPVEPDPDAVDPIENRVDELNSLIESSQETNQRVRDNRERAVNLAKIAECSKQTAVLQRAIEDLDDDKAAQLRAATFPIEGLAFDDQAVTLNSLPFDQASSAERLRVSVAMGLAMNPELKILLIRDGSLLDATSKAIIAQMAKDAGGQVWCEVVSKDSECQLIIEDGSVLETPEVTA